MCMSSNTLKKQYANPHQVKDLPAGAEEGTV